MNVYMDRYAQLSSSESLSLGSGNELGNSKIAASGDCGSLTERLPAEVEVTEAEFEDEAKAEGAKDSFTPKEGQTGLQAQEEEVMKEEFDSSGNVNLFSVTLAALGVGEEEEEDTLTDFLKLSDLEQLLPTVPKQTLSNTDSQTELDDQTKDLRCADTSGCLKSSDDKTQHEEAQEEEDDNEDDSEFSGYMAHR
ncbi:cytokine receptor family member b1 isoform X1 [Lates japonicus]|uniref:Cytokine receptor family member b1 isoform X1 n=1 Tax=Lates japonicus TaxID=270547 RepID=A0AAD3MJS1_LATJO|nr:cytokine receptor family member b1 isoform X1 [Lates japonicus]